MCKPSNTKPLTDKELRIMNTLIAASAPKLEFVCDYKNWLGETAPRHVQVIAFWFGVTRWHRTPGLFLKAIDQDKGEQRDFRVEDFDVATFQPLTMLQAAE
jgi:hypothetical protein